MTVDLDALANESVTDPTYVADMVIDPITKVASPTNIRAIVPASEPVVHSRESLKQLVDMVME